MMAAERIGRMSAEDVQKVRNWEYLVQALPQVDIATEHTLHAGMYARTIVIPADTILTGALIEVDTMLFVQGDVDVFMGARNVRLTGYHVLAADAGRKQAFRTYAETHVTMVFPTSAQNIADAEEEFTHEAQRLLSRRQLGHNPNIERTTPCQEP